MKELEQALRRIITEQVAAIGRPDLFRPPLAAFSDAGDPRFADLKEQIGPWHQLPSELLPEARSVISYFVPFTRAVAAQPRTVADGAPLWGEAYVVVNEALGHVNDAVAACLAEAGFSARTLPATHTYDPAVLHCLWSHRSAGVIAGLGAFGANRLVITDKGSGGRFCTVLTSAPLPSRLPPARERCLYLRTGACGLCFDICPVKALKPDGMDKFACQDELNKNDARQRARTGYEADVCGKCISVCPFAYIE